MSDRIQPDFEREVRNLSARLEALADTARPLFTRVNVARQVFSALTGGRPTEEVADLAASSGMHQLEDALENLLAATGAEEAR